MNIQELKNLRVGDKVKCCLMGEDYCKVGTVRSIYISDDNIENGEIDVSDCDSFFPEHYEPFKYHYKTAKEVMQEDDAPEKQCFIYNPAGEHMADVNDKETAELIVNALNLALRHYEG